MKHRLSLVSVSAADYDEAITYFTGKLKFELRATSVSVRKRGR